MDNSIEARTCLIRSGSPGESRALPALQRTDVWIFPVPAERCSTGRRAGPGDIRGSFAGSSAVSAAGAISDVSVCHRAQNLASAPEKDGVSRYFLRPIEGAQDPHGCEKTDAALSPTPGSRATH